MSKKRANGDGSIFRLPSGRWRGEIMDGYTPEGKRKRVTFSGETKAEVADKIREFQSQRRSLVFLDRSLLFCDWADSWYADYKSQVQPSTYSGYRYTLTILKNFFARDRLADIRPTRVNAFLNRLIEKGYSLSQINKCRAMLIQIFDAADADGLVVKNPARYAKPIRDVTGTLSQPRRQKDAFTDQEVRLLIENLPQDMLGHSIRLMLGTGLRVQELIALSPHDIAEDGSSLHVEKAIKMVDGYPQMGPPKSKKSIRTVPIPGNFRESALYLREHETNDLIWHGTGQNPYCGVGSFRRRYYAALRAIGGVRLLSPHCCRHTYATRLQECGVPMESIARLVGHSNIQTTDRYTHISLDTLSKSVSVLNTEKEGIGSLTQTKAG